MDTQPILIGPNARLFPSNWRPVREEIAFAHQNNFTSIQLPGPKQGLNAERLGDSIEAVAAAFRETALVGVMEMVMGVGMNGNTPAGATPMDVLRANLPAITALPIQCVHWHLVHAEPMSRSDAHQLERTLAPQLAAAVELTAVYGVRFGLEHNIRESRLFATPDRCAAILDAVPGLGLVFDINHAAPDEAAAYFELAPRMTALHVADTPLPDVNHHLPLGQGNIDFVAYFRELLERGFSGPAILEIGGQYKSGGFGRDTDAALIDSRDRLRAAINADRSELL